MNEKKIEELKKELRIHLHLPVDIYLKLYKIQEEKGCYTHQINTQIVEILKKHFENQKVPKKTKKKSKESDQSLADMEFDHWVSGGLD